MNPLLPAVIILSLCVLAATLRLNWYSKKHQWLKAEYAELNRLTDEMLAAFLRTPEITYAQLLEEIREIKRVDREVP